MKRGPDSRALGISLALHAVVLLPLVVFARPPEPIEFETYRVNLVAAPEMVEPRPTPPPEEPEPRPTPVEPEPEPEPQPEPEAEAREEPPEPEPEPQPEEDIEKPPETPDPTPETTEDAEATEEAGNAPVNLSTEGLEFPFPDYLANISTQLYRYIRWNEGSRPQGTVYFEILPDGTVRNIRMVEPSGNIRFDFAVQGAVETAGNRGAFGPLPDAYANPYLPVILEVEPPR